MQKTTAGSSIFKKYVGFSLKNIKIIKSDKFNLQRIASLSE